MTTGGDPDELDRLAAAGTAQGFVLDQAGRWLADVAGWHRTTTPTSAVDARPHAVRLGQFAGRLHDLDAWVRRVAAALRAADVASFATRLLALGPGNPTATHPPAPDQPPTRAHLRHLADDHLTSVASVPALPVAWRDAVHRERLRRWARRLDDRLAGVAPSALGPGMLDRFAAWVDGVLVDRVSPVTDLHVTPAETAVRLRDEAAGVRRLLADPDLQLLSFEVVGGRPTVRVALGDVAAAQHLAVLLPGTGAGVHAVGPSLEDLQALHDRSTRLASGRAVATVLDLYAAPLDLGAASDALPSRAAGAATAAFLADLPDAPPTTLVGHSYGALAAARASDAHSVADLVLLGAPGVGVAHRRDLLGADRVWVAQAGGDPITVVADLDEHVRRLPPALRAALPRPPLLAHGPDPADPEFGARRLPTEATGPGVAPPPSRGHLQYLRPDTVGLDSVARVVVGRRPGGRA